MNDSGTTEVLDGSRSSSAAAVSAVVDAAAGRSSIVLGTYTGLKLK